MEAVAQGSAAGGGGAEEAGAGAAAAAAPPQQQAGPLQMVAAAGGGGEATPSQEAASEAGARPDAVTPGGFELRPLTMKDMKEAMKQVSCSSRCSSLVGAPAKNPSLAEYKPMPAGIYGPVWKGFCPSCEHPLFASRLLHGARSPSSYHS